MSEEEKKAIEILKQIEYFSGLCINCPIEDDMDCNYCRTDAEKIILNLIKKQQQELQLKDKVIEEMAEMLVKVPDNANNPTTAVAIAMINRNLELKKEQVKRYVINKVKGEH